MSAAERLNAALSGRYAIERELGQGGMATVYLAVDLKHNRHVAIKVLKAELAAVLGIERFLAEIETTAQLQHPGILPLFDSGEADGMVFFVMPYVEDETLRQRLDREHQLPVAEAVRIATEVAEALDYAHRQGVVHRDIKPANILLREGRPLVADFGIALAASRSGGSERLTETGMSMGTPYYMSPEQATGSEGVGMATDVYALGCVLYEMLVGEPPYTGSTPQAVLGKIITGLADPASATRKTVPANLDAAIARSTEKIPADRFRTAGEFAAALADPTYRYGAVDAGSVASPGPWKAIAAASIVAAALAVGALALGVGGGSEPLPVVRHQIAPIADGMPRPIGTFTAIAPDGSSMVYAVAENQGADPTQLRWSLWLKRRAEIEPTLLLGTEQGQNLTYSPDGRSIVYVSGPQLRRRPVADGSPVTLAQGLAPGSTSMIALAWMDDGTILYELPGSTLMRIPEEGGTPDTVQVVGANGLGYSQLSYVGALPGSRGALLTICPQACAQTVALAVMDFEADTTRILLDEVVRGWYTPTGHVVYVRRDGRVFAAPFDLDALELAGPGVPLYEGVAVDVTSPQMVMSLEGTLVYARGFTTVGTSNRELAWVDRSGRQVDRSGPSLSGTIFNVALSPDDDRVALSMLDVVSGAPQLFVKELPDGPLTRLTADSGFTRRPVWSADGREITYITDETGPYEVRRLPADGSTSSRFDAVLDREAFEVVVSNDGDGLIFREGNANVGAADLRYLDLATGVVEEDLLATDFNERAVSLSADGRWMAYVSDAAGRDEVFVRPFGVEAYQVQISASGGTNPVWAHNGRELFYIDAEGWLSVASYTADPEFDVTERTRLFDANSYYQWSDDWRRFDVTRDDGQFLMVAGVAVEGEPSEALTYYYVQNFFEELRTLPGG